jgi:hypothetical protein
MGQEGVDPLTIELEDFIEAFELVRGRQDQVDLAAFLPPRDHPLHLEEYQDPFPELFQDREGLQAIAFEDYRLRHLLGDKPSPAVYQQRWKVNTENWPGVGNHIPPEVAPPR